MAVPLSALPTKAANPKNIRVTAQVGEIVRYSYNYKFLLTYSYRHAIIFTVLTAVPPTAANGLDPPTSSFTNRPQGKTRFRQSERGIWTMPATDGPIPAKPARSLSPGFTVIEIVVVMVLMSIITAVVLGRSITTSEIDVVGQTDKIRNHLRYAQAIAMKRSDTVWGIEFAADKYRFFSGTSPQNNEILLPGGEYSGGDTFIKYSDLGVSITVAGLSPSGAVFFDRFGKPYDDYTNNSPLLSAASITISAGGESRSIQITPETGLIQ